MELPLPSSKEETPGQILATSLREEGNALYKAGKLDEACKKYEEAIKLAPADNAPLRNLSAALYELGDYKACTRTAAEAIALLGEETGDEVVANIQKLNQRVEKAKIHTYEAPEEERRLQRLKISQNLPRYRPSMFVTTEYFTVGHDIASTLFGDDGIFERFSAKSKKVSFFFGGIGDARNAFQTLSVIAELEKAHKIPQRQYHLTLNDIHKAVLARDLVICLLLEDLSKVDENSDDGLMILNTIFFIFISTMMPAYAFDHLNQTIDRALGSLKAGWQPLKWLYLHKEDFPYYLAALGHWRDTAPKVLTNRQIMMKVAVAMMQKLPGHLSDPARKPYKNEERLYREVAVLFPPLEILKRHDPEMLKLVEKISSTTKGDSKAFEKHIEEHWHWNTTLMDKEWYNDMEQAGRFDVGFDPFETINHFPYDEVPTKPKISDQLFDYVAPFFIDAAKAINHVRGRLQVEAMLGDYAEIAERLQFDLFKTEDGKKSRPEHFPTVYDRIHLSNVPDYMGGHLSTFLYALPILRRSPAANVKANCLRNSDSFDKVEDYLSEYQLIPDDVALAALFQVAILIRENPNLPYPLADFTFYLWSQPNLKHEFSSLLSRKAFSKWFYGLFFRLALPYYQDLAQHMKIIFSPLNLTVLFRLITHLHTLGYPSHWLSELLNSIIENKVITTVRPPRTKPMRPADVRREYCSRHLCTTPFSHEMATLARIFQPLLPLSLTSANIPQEKEIYKYQFSIPTYENILPCPSNLMLVFFNNDYCGTPRDPWFEVIMTALRDDLRSLLDPSWGNEVDSKVKGSAYDNLINKGLIVWSTFEWDTENKVASAWMPESLIECMLKDGKNWMMGIVRTDIWTAAFQLPVYLVEAVTKGNQWNA